MLLFSILFNHLSFSQNVSFINDAVDNDSSFYHIATITPNEFWVGGEYGVLYKVDSLGSTTKIHYPGKGAHILHILNHGKFVFLATDQGELIRYEKGTGQWKYKQFHGFANKAFYSGSISHTGEIILAGGNRKIAYGKAAIPFGFVATTDTGMENIKIQWKNIRKFVWSVYSNGSESIATAFNGRKSILLHSNTAELWKRKWTIKGLIYELFEDSSKLIYCGGRSYKVAEPGFHGSFSDKQQYVNDSTGMFFGIEVVVKDKFYVSNNGYIIHQKQTDSPAVTCIKKGNPLYDVEKIGDRKLLVCGHGKFLCILNY